MRVFLNSEDFFFVILELGQNVKAMNANQVAILPEAWVSEKFLRSKVIDSVIQIGWVRKSKIGFQTK
ncbi:hypothetical protein D3C76_1883060 [compost metagenome]